MSRFIVAAAFAFTAAVPCLALLFELSAYADGSAFSYAATAGNGWGLHWHNISNRITVYLVAYVPAEAIGAATGSPRAAFAAYTLLFYSAPFAGLATTAMIDRSERRVFTLAAAIGTLVALPLILPFPSETVFTHALFFPTLALAHRKDSAALPLAILTTALVNTHEAALVAAALIVASTLLALPAKASLIRAIVAFGAAVAIWLALRLALPPGDYIAPVLANGAMQFLTVANWAARAVFWALAAAAGVFVFGLVLSAWLGRKGAALAAGLGILAAAAAYIAVDPAVHASERYGVRLVVLVIDSLAACIAVLTHARAAGTGRWLLRFEPAFLAPSLGKAAAPAAAALAVVMTIHAIEWTRFIVAWRTYTADVRALAMGDASDPALGDPRFVSTARLPARRDEMKWNSTTLYLSVVLAPGFDPRRLVIDPEGGYFWMDCRTATASRDGVSPLPLGARTLTAVFACSRRP